MVASQGSLSAEFLFAVAVAYQDVAVECQVAGVAVVTYQAVEYLIVAYLGVVVGVAVAYQAVAYQAVAYLVVTCQVAFAAVEDQFSSESAAYLTALVVVAVAVQVASADPFEPVVAASCLPAAVVKDSSFQAESSLAAVVVAASFVSVVAVVVAATAVVEYFQLAVVEFLQVVAFVESFLAVDLL